MICYFSYIYMSFYMQNKMIETPRANLRENFCNNRNAPGRDWGAKKGGWHCPKLHFSFSIHLISEGPPSAPLILFKAFFFEMKLRLRRNGDFMLYKAIHIPQMKYPTATGMIHSEGRMGPKNLHRAVRSCGWVVNRQFADNAFLILAKHKTYACRHIKIRIYTQRLVIDN